MPQEILHIYGPFAIQWYGVMILLGLLMFMWRASKNPLRKKYLSETEFFNLVAYSIIAGIIGGRVLNFLSEREYYENIFDILKIWEGGFSILGTIIAVTLFVPWYLHKHKAPILPILDLAALYAPLLQAIARIGCLFAGCCHGMVTTAAWAVTCHNPNMPELIGLPVHPTQLYSAGALFTIFLIQRYVVYPRVTKAGQLFSSYLILAGLERFGIDFWRAHRILVIGNFSSYQLLALSIIMLGCISYIFCTFVNSKKHEHF